MTSTTRNTHRPGRPSPRDMPRRPQPDRITPEQDGDAFYDDEGATAAQSQELTEIEGHYVTARLCGEPVRIVPPGAWRQSWNRALHAGQVDEFVEYVLHPADVDLYYELDPTNEEFGEFIASSGDVSGESLGKSRGRGRSSRTTRRR